MNNARIKLSEYCHIVGRSIDPQANPHETFAHYSIPAFDRCLGPSLESGEAIKSNKLEIPHGVVLFSKLNPRIPRVWYVSEETSHRRIASTEFVPLQFDQSTVDGRFLAYALQEPVTINYLRGEVAAATKSRERLAPERVLDAELPLPPLTRQREIVTRLDAQLAAAARARAAVAAQLAEAERLEPALIAEAFASSFVGAAPRQTLDALCKIGTGTTPSRAVPAYFGTDHPWVTPGDLGASIYLSSSREGLSSLGVEEGRGRLFPARTVLLVCIGATIGKVGIASVPMGANQQLNGLTCGERLDPEYLFFWLKTQRQRFFEDGGSVTLPIINQSRLGSYELPLPPLEAQREIADHLLASVNHVAALRTRLGAQLAELDRLPAALLRTAFADP